MLPFFSSFLVFSGSNYFFSLKLKKKVQRNFYTWFKGSLSSKFYSHDYVSEIFDPLK